MPNHVTNIIISDTECAHFLLTGETEDTFRGAVPAVDFNKLIPQPPNIETEGCSGHTYGDAHETFSGRPDQPDNDGVICWYAWNSTYWGTKWGAYNGEVPDDTSLKFDTAWSAPEPIFDALAARFPDSRIMIAYADEDFGQNCGAMLYEHGVLQESFDFGGEDAGEHLAAILLYGTSLLEYLEGRLAEEEGWLKEHPEFDDTSEREHIEWLRERVEAERAAQAARGNRPVTLRELTAGYRELEGSEG